MRQDEFGATLEAALKSSDHPLTASELRDEVGCSRQRVYTWLQANALHVVEQGKDRAGGKRYSWLDGRPIIDPGLMADTFKLHSFHVDQGKVVLVVIGPDGARYNATPVQ
jgi:hypothetical protein